MSFGQLTNRENLRDTVSCLLAHQSKLYHFGIKYPVNLSTLALANETGDWRIYADFAQILLQKARQLYLADDFGLENAVKTQMWIAIYTYLLVAIIKKELKIEKSLSEILQIISVSIVDKSHLNQLFSELDSKVPTELFAKQLNLFDL